MLLGDTFERYATQTPICVAARGLMEAALDPAALDEPFARTARRPYERELLFSTGVDLMAGVVCRTHRSVSAAYRASAAAVGVSLPCLYDKRAGSSRRCRPPWSGTRPTGWGR